jgi:CBS domain-containing protein
MPQLFGEVLSVEGLEAIHARARSVTSREILTRSVVTANEDEHVPEVVQRMIEHHLHRLPVVPEGVPVGMLTRRDLLHLMTDTELGSPISRR